MKEVGGNCRGYILSSNEKVEAVKRQNYCHGATVQHKGAGIWEEKCNLVVWRRCCRCGAFMCRKWSGNGGCSLWLWLKQVNRRQWRFVWQSGCCLDVLKASRACIHPQACVCLMSYWQAVGTRVPVPRGKHTFHRLWLHKPVWLLGEKKYERNQSANKLRVLSQSGGEKKKRKTWATLDFDRIFMRSLTKICIVITDNWWCFYLVVHFCEICKM